MLKRRRMGGEHKDGDDDGDECDDDNMARLWTSCESFLLPCFTG